MARVDADRNLLLGILAQQMDFVSRDALFGAMNAWIIRKETSLGALLVERGDLAKSRRALLEALVDEHVRAHGGDPARSLQALSSVGPVADDLGKLADSDLRASVGHLRNPGADPSGDGGIETRAPTSLGEPTSWNGRFRVVRPHASGGLGVVSVALDDELDREVAFKEIKDRFADDGGRRARFVLEAEITGKLEHPGIIPIYGLGHDPTGRPFYAMRFIRGDSLADAIRRYHDPNGPYVEPTRRSLQLRELLNRFLDVCDALAYAHSRGILHRDLKPGNIMLGPFGETLVVDWGLALPLERVPEGQDSTQGPVKPTRADGASLHREQGEVVGTPAYMPPEQAEGALDKLGPRSDVYGLGAILYDLLTGKPPVEGNSLEEVLQRVNRGEIRPPRQVRPEVPPALETVCLKALALKPEDRYPTPRALAADLKAWLADEPVSARPEPFAERARRWSKRNRTAVTAAAASLLVGLVGLGAVATVQTSARNDLDRKNGDLSAANAALDAQRRRAEDREAQAIAAVKKFGDVITNEPVLKNTPALEALRKRLLNEPLAFFRALRDRLQADHDTRPESLTRLADASFDLGKLTDEIGDKQDALIVHGEALAIRRRLADANHTVTGFQSGLAASHHNIGNLLSETGRPAEALKAFEVSLGTWRKLAEANPAVTEFQNGLAASRNNIGLLLSETGRPAEALQAYQSALGIWQTLAEANPAVTEFQSDMARSQNRIGNLLRDIGRPAEALQAYRSALGIRQTLAEANPAVTGSQSDLAASHHNIGLLLSETGRPAEALQAYRSALGIWQTLAEANPAVTGFQSGLSASHNNIGALLRETGRLAEALQAYESALAINRRLAEANAAVTRIQSDLAASHHNIGAVLRESGRPAEALQAYQSALAIRRRLAEANPAVTEFQSDLSASHYSIGLLLTKTGRPAEALQEYQSALAIHQELAWKHPGSPNIATELGLTLNGLAAVDLDARRFSVARDRLRLAIGWQKKAFTSNSENPIYRRHLIVYLNNMIQAARGLGEDGDVAEAEREIAALRDSDPAVVALDARLAMIVRGDQQPGDNPDRLALAQRSYEKGIHAAAAKLWSDALDADPNLAEDRQAQHRYNAACSAAIAGCGRGKDDPTPNEAARTKLREQARAWLQGELAAWTKLVESGPERARQPTAQSLLHWREDADLAGVRDPKALEALPGSERDAWQALWASVEALLARAQGATQPVGEK